MDTSSDVRKILSKILPNYTQAAGSSKLLHTTPGSLSNAYKEANKGLNGASRARVPSPKGKVLTSEFQVAFIAFLIEGLAMYFDSLKESGPHWIVCAKEHKSLYVVVNAEPTREILSMNKGTKKAKFIDNQLFFTTCKPIPCEIINAWLTHSLELMSQGRISKKAKSCGLPIDIHAERAISEESESDLNESDEEGYCPSKRQRESQATDDEAEIKPADKTGIVPVSSFMDEKLDVDPWMTTATYDDF
ncbi:hypothetical protein FPV67DRAFT_1449984 [Lyophyllum atratum]|nr:hypothetical protein FPV67DRAFT_1449984 [Lyophyllum atratum]